MYVEKCEADDIIATLVKEQKDEKYLIVSGDKDFIQLHSYKNVKQFSPILKGFVGEGVDPKQFLYEQIIKGDRSDGVPNVLSPDDIFLQEGARQKPINKKRLEEFKDIETNVTIESDTKVNYQRNKTLIDLSQIPDHIEKNIINTFTNYKVNDRTLLFNYFIENKLRSLIENINDF
jgi:5'-3' exonuclease